jgi:hypothetical protein
MYKISRSLYFFFNLDSAGEGGTWNHGKETFYEKPKKVLQVFQKNCGKTFEIL